MTPRLFLSVLALAAISFGAGCTALGASGSTDWYDIGVIEGRLGAFPQDEYFASRFSTPGDREKYLRGWQDGFAQRPNPAS